MARKKSAFPKFEVIQPEGDFNSTNNEPGFLYYNEQPVAVLEGATGAVKTTLTAEGFSKAAELYEKEFNKHKESK